MSKKHYDAIIFDLDGVLCHTDCYHYQAWSRACSDWNLPFSANINDQLRGVSREESVELILKAAGRQMSQQEKERFASAKNQYYCEMLLQLSENDLGEDARLTLTTLRKWKIPMAVASSSKNATIILDRLGIKSIFNVIIDGTMIKHSKPNPEVFLMAAMNLGKKPSDCLIVEDSVAGVQAAKLGDFHSVGFGNESVYKITDYSAMKLSDILSIFE